MKINTVTMNAHSAAEVAEMIESAEWKPVTTGALAGSRYFLCEHGVVLQRPNPSNEMSLIAKETAEIIGIIES